MIPHQYQDLIFHVIVACSVAHSLLPPWEFLNDFPTAQKIYKLFVYTVGYIGINGRSTIYKSISINNPNGSNSGNGGNGSAPTKTP